MRWFAVLVLSLAVLMIPQTTLSTYAAEPCGTESWNYSPGKTREGFQATATDGCHTYRWTSNTTDSQASGIVTFQTTTRINPWDGDLPNAPGAAGQCEMRAAHEANLMFIYGFKVGPGTNVTVRYACD